MKRQQFSEEQIIGILKEAEAGAVVTELETRKNRYSRLKATRLDDADAAGRKRGSSRIDFCSTRR